MKNKCCNHELNEECGCGLCRTRISHLGVTLNNKEILRDINLEIYCGDLTAVIGPNGAGKTTLFKAILGEIPHMGMIEFLDPKDNKKGCPVIGYVPQKLDFDNSSPVTVLDLFTATYNRFPVWLGSSQKTKKRVQKNLTLVQAEHLLNRKLGALSGGELQRVLLALALDPVPNLLFLDEPVSGIDQKGLELFYDIVSRLRQDYDLSIILVSHDLNLVAKYADRVILLNHATIECCGTAAEVFDNEKVIETFGMGWAKGNVESKRKEEEQTNDRTMV
ncbi:MAG: metal ABC transporter ATP-binding protein [Dehalobacter sp. 4CP]|uniref:metal ABC transporter ATP-binding protein n=1 Tax=Dehalobacter sp. CP TaxID=2594474 RepID=UPI0013CA11FC|nr:metal ABC transporter ATP-binding protein [Dehalobacter sp. 4CP]